MARWNPDATPEKQLEYFQGNYGAAQNEISELKNIWAQESKDGASQDRLNQISSWADQVRAAAGISNYDPTYGNAPNVSPVSGTTPSLTSNPLASPASYDSSSPAPDSSGWASSAPVDPSPYGGGSSSSTTTPDGATYGQAKVVPGGFITADGTFIPMGGNQTTGGGGMAPGTGLGGTPNTQMQQLMQQFQNQQTQTDKMVAELNKTIAELTNRNNADRLAAEQKAKDEAAAQAQKIASEKKASFQTVIDSLLSGQKGELENITNSLEDAEQGIEDQTFQQWLQARQQSANSGLGNSGLANDANTRLLLNKQRALANLYTQSQANSSRINTSYNDKLAQAQQQLSGVSQSDIEKQLLAEARKTGDDRLMEQAKLFADIIKTTSGYDKLKPSDIIGGINDSNKIEFDYAKLSQEGKQFYDKLKTDTKTELAKIGFDYDKLNSDERRFYAKLNSDEVANVVKMERDYGFKMTELMGVDANGNPTLDARKFLAKNELDIVKVNETLRHNRVTESLTAQRNAASAANAANRNQIDAARLSATVANNQAQLQLKVREMTLDGQNTAFKNQAQLLMDVSDSKGQRVDQLAKQINTFKGTNGKVDMDDLPDGLYDSYLQAQKEYDGAVNAVELLANSSSRTTARNGGYTINPGGR